MHKKRILFLAAIIMVGALHVQSVFAADLVKVFYNEQEIAYDVPPQIMSERTMVPLRTTIETITGETMEWDEATKTVTFVANGHTNTHTIGQTVVFVDGEPTEFDTPSVIIDSRTLVPVRMIAETSGCNVEWDGTNKYVLITSQAEPEKEPVGEQPSIISVSANNDTIKEGETAVLTVKTNSMVKNVWIDDGIGNADAAYRAIDSAGIKTWTVICKPGYSRDVVVYANTSKTTENSASVKQHINVVGAPVKIINVSTDKSTLYAGDSVTLLIRTNNTAAVVWADYDGASTEATLQTTHESGEKSWSVSILLNNTQQVRVFANTSKVISGAAVETKIIEVNEALAEVLSATASKTAVSAGERFTITATTNSAAKYVWVYTGSSSVIMTLDSTDSSGEKTWTTELDVSSSGDLVVYASSTGQNYKDSMKIITVTVL